MKKALVVLLAVATIGTLFFALKPQPKTTQNKVAGSQAVPKPETRTFNLEVKDGELVNHGKTLTVNQGDEVHITVTSSAPDELHLHGYDKEVELTAGQPSKLDFTANLSGRFEAEFHHADKTIFVLEVQPK